MGRISEIESDADVASRKTGTGTSTGTSKRSKANKATAKKGKADSTGDRQSTPGKGAGKDVNTVVDPNYEPPTDPFVNFSLVTLAGIQLALQTEHLSPFFNSLPLTRWSRWVGVLGVVLVAALLPSPNSLRILLTFAALSCDLSVIYGRKIGSAFGLRLGPEWGPAAASAAMSAGALLAVTRLAVGRKASPLKAIVQAIAVTGTLWTGELMSRKFFQLTGCVACRRLTAGPETLTLVLAVLYTGFALVSHSPDITSKNRFSRKYSRVYVVIFTVPALVFAAYQLLRHPSTPFHIPDGNGGTSTVLLSQKGVSGRIVVSEVAHESGWQYRFLRADHSILGGQWLTKVTDDKGVNRMEFSDSIFAAFPLQEVLLLAERGDLSAPPRPAPGESALVIGLGVGIAATQFIRRGLMVDVVEYDQVVYDSAAKYFSYGKKRPRSHAITDGAAYVRDAASAKRGNPDAPRWNYVVQDCFSAGSLPVELFTTEFWNDVQDVLTPDGVVVMNFAGIIDSRASRKVVRTLLSVFPQCRVFSDLEHIDRHAACNLVFVCSGTYDPLLTFRRATFEDIDNSSIRNLVYRTFIKNEVPVDSFLLEADWEDPSMVLHTGDRLDYWNDAVASWHLIEKILSPEMWMAY